MSANGITPSGSYQLGDQELHLVATLRAFQLFKAQTKELGHGRPNKLGIPQGLSIMRGELDQLDEDTTAHLLWALAHGRDNAGQELGFPTIADVEAGLQNPHDIVQALDVVTELVEEALPAEGPPSDLDAIRAAVTLRSYVQGLQEANVELGVVGGDGVNLEEVDCELELVQASVLQRIAAGAEDPQPEAETTT